MKPLKYSNIILLLMVIFSISACVYTDYEYVAPKSSRGKSCVAMCQMQKQNCKIATQSRYDSCMSRYERKNETWKCSSSTHECGSAYIECFELCGGKVIPVEKEF